MLDRPRYRCHRFSGRPEGFGEDASFFFDRAGFGSARWQPRMTAQPPVPSSSHIVGRRIGWLLVVVGLVLCLVVLAGLAPRLLLRRASAVIVPGATQAVIRVHTISARSNGLMVPLSALRIDKQEAYVAIVDDKDIAHFRKVQLGGQTHREAEILSGLDGTEAIIAPLPDTLQEGMKVSCKENGDASGY